MGKAENKEGVDWEGVIEKDPVLEGRERREGSREGRAASRERERKGRRFVVLVIMLFVTLLTAGGGPGSLRLCCRQPA